MGIEWTRARRDALRSFCDTIFASIPADLDEHGFWVRKASDFGVDRALALALDTPCYEAFRSSLVDVVDALAGRRLHGSALAQREAAVRSVAASSRDRRAGVGLLTQIVLTLCYGLTDADGNNANWPAVGYLGPRAGTPAGAAAAPRADDRPIQPLVIDRDQVLEADVCVIGSGAGGGVIAGELASRGHGVVVLEAGGYFQDTDLDHGELWAYENLYWRGGVTASADGNLGLLAGGALGGGTLVNRASCMTPPPWVLREWAEHHGLDGIDGPAFDRTLRAILERVRTDDHHTELDGSHQRLEAGARALGYRLRRHQRNPAPDHPQASQPGDSELGHRGSGIVAVNPRSTVRTYLADAQAHGARIVVRARAERIIADRGQAAGVEAVVAGSGGEHRLTIRARHVVAACGALETPALLLRSALGGPAAGRHLHVHPALLVSGIYPEEQRSWWAAPPSLVVDEPVEPADGHGFCVEPAHQTVARSAAMLPWTSALAHKAAMTRSPQIASFIALPRDRSGGTISVDGRGACVPTYAVTDERDVALLRRALHELIRLHDAAGAKYIFATVRNEVVRWHRGDSLNGFVEYLCAAPFGAGGHALHSAHQMSTARIGRDPRDSVAQPTGELHDLRGVWIGDASAFPTALGANPMITCMALAARTAEHIAAALR